MHSFFSSAFQLSDPGVGRTLKGKQQMYDGDLGAAMHNLLRLALGF